MIPGCKWDQSPAFSLFAFRLGQINAGDTQGSTGSLHPCCASLWGTGKAMASSSPAASSTPYHLQRQEKVSDMLFSCAPEKCIICPTNLVICWTDRPESCEPLQNQVGYIPTIVLHSAARFIFLFKTTLYRRQMKSWNNRIPHCSQHSSLLAKLFR